MNSFNHNTIIGLLNCINEGFQLIDFDWRYKFVNDAVVNQSKYKTKEDLLGFTMMEKYPGIEDTEMFKNLENCMKNRIDVQFENKFTFPDNSEEWFELIVKSVPEGIFILSIDISERKKSEQRKKEYCDSLERMLTMTSNNMRRPLTNCIGLIHLLENKNNTDAEYSAIVNHLKDSAEKLESFTQYLDGNVGKVRDKYIDLVW